MRLDAVAVRLTGVVWESDSQFMARCPCHDDKRSSLAVGIGRSGSVIVHCFAGCRSVDVLRVLGADGRVEPSTIRRAEKPCPTFSWSMGAALALQPRLVLTHGWDYQDASGDTPFCVYRFRRADGGKEIRPVTRTPDGFAFGLPPVPRPLFRLPQMLASSGVVVVVEGEKTCEAVERAGWTATTSVGGASGASRTDWSPLALRNVVIWPDNDEAGVAYAKDVGEILRAMRCSVRTMRPVGGPGEDAADCADVSARIESGT